MSHVTSTVVLRLQPVSIPDYIYAVPMQSGGQPIPVPYAELEPGAIEQLCERFKQAMYERAGKHPPPRESCQCGRVIA